MNFNQQPPSNNEQNSPRQIQPQQQQPPQRNAFPMLPPQLANLTPQQLQQLRNQPQFQNLMRNYIQRQQIIQQQQQQQMLNAQNQHNPALVNNLQVVAGITQHSPAAQQPIISPQANAVPQQRPPNSVPVPSSQQARPQQIHQGRPTIPPHNGVLQGEVPPNTTAAQQKTNQVIKPRDPKLSPQIPNDVLNKIPLKTLKSVNEWSEKLKSEGKDIPSDLKVYESIVRKDSDFMNKYAKQLSSSKRMLDDLVKDIKSYADIKQLRMNAISLSSKGQLNNSIWGEGYQGYGNGVTNAATRLVLPEKDITDREINERVLRNKFKHLVPIRLEFDQERDRFKLRDTFLWDLNEEVLSVESFVKSLINDYKFISKSHFETILSSVKEQINDYHKKPDKTMGELRIPIRIDITINNTQLTDQFEWDILNFEDNDPEEFAIIMCDEMNLPGEFTTAIAHSIREQTQLFHKALHLIGYSFDGSPVNEDEIRNHILPSLRLISQDYTLVDDFFSILRNPSNVADYSPSLVKLTQLEVERLDKEIERESRRKRRHNNNEQESSTAGRGTTSRRNALHAGRGSKTLPELSDIPKTFRTPAPSSILPGAVDLGVPDIYEYNEAFVHKTQIKNPDYKPPQPKTSTDDKVRYYHDMNQGRFFVKIKIPPR